MKRAKRIASRLLLGFLVLLLLYTLALFVFPKIRFDASNANSGEGIVQCFLKSNGSHVDIVMPIRTDSFDWSQILSQKDIEYKDSVFAWVAFGWGDKNFYLNTPTWGDLTFSTAFNAAFWLSTGAIHVTYYAALEKSENCLPFELSKEQAGKLFEFIAQDFQLSSGKVMHIPTERVYGPRDAFYDSNKRYSVFHTCNTWVNDAFKFSGYQHCLWTALEFGVMDLLRE